MELCSDDELAAFREYPTKDVMKVGRDFSVCRTMASYTPRPAILKLGPKMYTRMYTPKPLCTGEALITIEVRGRGM